MTVTTTKIEDQRRGARTKHIVPLDSTIADETI